MTTWRILCLVCLSSSLFAYATNADNLVTEAESVRAKIAQLKESIARLQSKVEALEKRLEALEVQHKTLYPWQREQPFYWDSRMPVGTPRGFRDRQRGRPPTLIRRLDEGSRPWLPEW